MRSIIRPVILPLGITLAVLCTGCSPDPTTPGGEATDDGQAPLVTSITTIVAQTGGRVDWGSNDVIAHGRYGEDGYYDLWVMNPDGTGANCLTCDAAGVPQLHNGQPVWHPSGEYIVFQSQDPALPHTPRQDRLQTQPGFGMHNNLWVTDPAGDRFTQLTAIESNRSILHAHFSHDGAKLMWGQRIGDGASDWTIMIADFVSDPEPRLENSRSYSPLGVVWYETHAFSPDDSKVLFTAGTEEGGWRGFDLWEMTLATQELTQLTDDADVWDEHAHYSPDGSLIVWSSSRGYTYDSESRALSDVIRSLRLDYWLMDADGANAQRMTYFNEPGHDQYLGEQVLAADSSWSPDGRRLASTILTASGRENARIVIIELDDARGGKQSGGDGE